VFAAGSSVAAGAVSFVSLLPELQAAKSRINTPSHSNRILFLLMWFISPPEDSEVRLSAIEFGPTLPQFGNRWFNIRL
jgi:hypothetical protein